MQTSDRWTPIWIFVAIVAPMASAAETPATALRLETRPAVAASSRALAPAAPAEDLEALFERGADPRSLAAGDFDEDGVPDLAAGYAAGRA